MTRLEEIEARMAAITEECEQENADIDALTEEDSALFPGVSAEMPNGTLRYRQQRFSLPFSCPPETF